MGSEGDLGKIEEKQLPPRKRPGWTGGDDRTVRGENDSRVRQDVVGEGQVASGVADRTVALEDVDGREDATVVSVEGEEEREALEMTASGEGSMQSDDR